MSQNVPVFPHFVFYVLCDSSLGKGRTALGAQLQTDDEQHTVLREYVYFTPNRFAQHVCLGFEAL